jgi:ParB family transcriptional regulator, chromosome partitioning protein
MAKKRLGIDALFQSSVPPARMPEESVLGEYRDVPIDALRPAGRQPRRNFDAAGLEQLTASIAARGVLQPLLVRPTAEERTFEIVAGERRWRAARAAGLKQVPVRVVSLDDRESFVVAVTENLQREDLSPIDEAESYLELLRATLDIEPAYAAYRGAENPTAGVLRVLRALNNRAAGNTKDNVVLSLEPVITSVFDTIGRLSWQSFVSHRVPLLSLPSDVLGAVRDRGLPYTKARAIARITAERLSTDEMAARKVRRDLIEQALTEGLSVRNLNDEIAKLFGSGDMDAATAPLRNRSGLEGRVIDLQRRLSQFDLETYGPAKRADITSAIETLLRLL